MLPLLGKWLRVKVDFKVVVVVPVFEAKKKTPAVFSLFQVLRLLRSIVRQKRRVVSNAFQQLEPQEQDLKNCGLRVFVKKKFNTTLKEAEYTTCTVHSQYIQSCKSKISPKPSTSCRMQNTIMGICNRFAMLYI